MDGEVSCFTGTENCQLRDEMVKAGLPTRLSSKLRPDCVRFRSDPSAGLIRTKFSQYDF